MVTYAGLILLISGALSVLFAIVSLSSDTRLLVPMIGEPSPADDATRTTHELTGWALERGASFESLEVARPSLEDVYLELTGGEEGAG